MITSPENCGWGWVNQYQIDQRYTSPAELQRRERVAVGQICGCGDCVCCGELKPAKPTGTG